MSNIFKNMTDEELAYELKLSARRRGSMLKTEAIMIEIFRRQIKPKKMSRYHTTGIDPENGETVNVCYGWDQVPGFKAGYFFQVFSTNEDTIREDPSGEGILVNEGFLVGITKDRLKILAKQYNAKLKSI